MTLDSEKLDIAKRFHAALISADWAGIRALLTDDATWRLPGDNKVSGEARGGDAVVERAQLIASYGLNFKLEHILLSPENMALALHNTATRGDLVLDEHLATVCTLSGGKISGIETYLSDVEGMNAFFV